MQENIDMQENLIVEKLIMIQEFFWFFMRTMLFSLDFLWATSRFEIIINYYFMKYFSYQVIKTNSILELDYLISIVIY